MNYDLNFLRYLRSLLWRMRFSVCGMCFECATRSLPAGWLDLGFVLLPSGTWNAQCVSGTSVPRIGSVSP
jgi:hypothetical protein